MKLVRVYKLGDLATAELAERFSHAPDVPISELYKFIVESKELAFVVLDWPLNEPYVVLYELFVASDHRRRGVGTAALRIVESLARKRGCESVRLEPRPLDKSTTPEALKAWYEGKGYRTAPGDETGMMSKSLASTEDADTSRFRLTPVNLWNQSREFLAASQREFQIARFTMSYPAYFLAARSIELALKGFLLLRGSDEPRLRSIRHNLVIALREAKNVGLSESVSLDAADEGVIAWINDYYRSKDLEYPKTGLKSYPEARYLLATAAKIVNGMEVEMRKWRSSSLAGTDSAP